MWNECVQKDQINGRLCRYASQSITMAWYPSSNHIDILGSIQNGRLFINDISNQFTWMKTFTIEMKFHWKLMPSFDALQIDVNENRISLISHNYCYITWDFHYSDVIMSVMVSQITGVSIVCSTVCSGSDQRKHQSSAPLVFVGEFTVDQLFPSQRASYVENVSIWWRHHVFLFARLSSEYN